MAKRFDRTDAGEKVHMQSLGALRAIAADQQKLTMVDWILAIALVNRDDHGGGGKPLSKFWKIIRSNLNESG